MRIRDEILIDIADTVDPEIRSQLACTALGWNMDPIAVQKAGRYTDEEMAALIDAAEPVRREREHSIAMREWAEKVRREGGYYPKERD